MSNAEGFGLGTHESVLAGTPMIATVTGGLQDQMRFEDENGKWIDFAPDFPSNHTGRYKKCGEWAFPLFPVTRSLTGSPLTPFIFEAYADILDAAKTLHYVYSLGRAGLKRRGMAGRNWMLSKESGMDAYNMAANFIHGIDTTLKNWKPRKRFTLLNANTGLKALDNSTITKHIGIIY